MVIEETLLLLICKRLRSNNKYIEAHSNKLDLIIQIKMNTPTIIEFITQYYQSISTEK